MTTISRILGLVGLTGATLSITLATVPPAAAAPCPDVEIVFARGTTEPPGVGGIGQAFVDSLRSRLGERSVGVYAVNYPASRDFGRSTPAGRDDVSAHVQSMATTCPNTRMVLGGYSQGAAVVDLATGGRRQRRRGCDLRRSEEQLCRFAVARSATRRCTALRREDRGDVRAERPDLFRRRTGLGRARRLRPVGNGRSGGFVRCGAAVSGR
jgi:hypothetical protein